MVSESRRHGNGRRRRGTADSRRPVIDGWLWWSSSPSARRRAKEQFEKLPSDVQGELLARMERYMNGESRPREVDDIGDGILELRYKQRRDPYRLLFSRWGRFAVVLDVFYKNQQKTDKARALKRAATWKRTRGESPPDPGPSANI